jgi:hypothetical protein
VAENVTELPRLGNNQNIHHSKECQYTTVKVGTYSNILGIKISVVDPDQLYNTCSVTIAEGCVQTDVRQLSPPHMLLLNAEHSGNQEHQLAG